MGKGTYKKAVFIGVVIIAILVIAYFYFGSKKETDTSSENTILSQTDSSSQAINEEPSKQRDENNDVNVDKRGSNSELKNEVKPTLEPVSTPDTSKQQQENSNAAKEEENQNQPVGTKKGNVKETPESKSVPKQDNGAIKIIKSEITSDAKFYPYKIDGINMELIAVKATDGTIRTALNTCQVCYDSGRGYYEQKGDYFICQNCGNRFHIDQVEKVKGGCNPVPVLEESKQDMGDYITISKDFMASQKELFSNWRK